MGRRRVYLASRLHNYATVACRVSLGLVLTGYHWGRAGVTRSHLYFSPSSSQADLIIVLGSSLTVRPGAGVPRVVKEKGGKLVICK